MRIMAIYRWIAEVESAFSSFKRMFDGEHVMARMYKIKS
jgi:hypothetical protein